MVSEIVWRPVLHLTTVQPPKGPYQPTKDMMLMFYSFYKQATLGPCNLQKPSFWDVINRAKWSAWSDLGNMSSTEAMNRYVEEIKKAWFQRKKLKKGDNDNVLRKSFRSLNKCQCLQMLMNLWKISRQYTIMRIIHLLDSQLWWSLLQVKVKRRELNLKNLSEIKLRDWSLWDTLWGGDRRWLTKSMSVKYFELSYSGVS